MDTRLAVTLAVGLLFAWAIPGIAANKDRESLAGTWAAVSIEKDGKEAPAERIRQTKLIVKGATFTLKVGDETVHEGTLKLNPAATPREIDGTITSGPDKGQKSLGIYELSGDRYKVCVAHAGRKRPTEFRTTPGDGRTLIIFERKKP